MYTKIHRKTKTRENRKIIRIFTYFCVVAFLATLAVVMPADDTYASNPSRTGAMSLRMDTSGWESAPAADIYIPDISALSVANATRVAYSGLNKKTATASDWNYHYDNNNYGKSLVGVAVTLDANAPHTTKQYYSGGVNYYIYDLDTVRGQRTYITLKWTNAARYRDNNGVMKNADVTLTIDNVQVRTRNSFAVTGTSVLYDYIYPDGHTEMQYSHMNRLSAGGGGNVATTYDAEWKFYDKSGNLLTGKNVLFGITDLDNCDIRVWQDQYTTDDYHKCTSEPASSTSYNQFMEYSFDGPTEKDRSIIKSEYVESVRILSGAADTVGGAAKIYSNAANDTGSVEYPWIRIIDMDESYQSTPDRIVAARVNASDANLLHQRNSGFVARMKADGFKFQISGHTVEEGIGLIRVSKVETDVTDPVGNQHATITPDDNEILWRNDKTVQITVDPGYRISSLVIDGVAMAPKTTLTLVSGNTYSYTFANITYDHTITVGTTPNELNICKIDDNGNKIDGAQMKLQGTTGEHFVSSQISQIPGATIDPADDSTIYWTSRSDSCATLLLPSPLGDANWVQIDEEKTPVGYIPFSGGIVIYNEGAIVDAPSDTTYSGNTIYIVDETSPTIQICKENAAQSLIPGATLSLTSTTSAFANTVISNITPTTSTSNTITWSTSGTQCIGLYGIPAGSYTLTETAAPSSYDTATQITINIDSWGYFLNNAGGGRLNADRTILYMSDEHSIGQLDVNQQVGGAGSDVNKQFEFTITITDNGGNPVLTELPFTLHTSAGVVSGIMSVVNNSASFRLRHNEYVRLTLKQGYQYRIDQDDYSSDGYTVSYNARTGTVTASSDATITDTKPASVITGVDDVKSPIAFIILGMVTSGLTMFAIYRVRFAKRTE